MSKRISSTYFIGVVSSSARNMRVRCRGLTRTRAASASRPWSAVGSPCTASWTSRSTGVRGAGPWSEAENCDWPPARCMYTTSERAT